MKKIPILLAVFISLFACKKEETRTESPVKMGDFSISTDKITAGKPLKINYNGDAKEMEAFYTYLVNNDQYPFDIEWNKENTATINIPDSVQAVAFTFLIDGKYDNNNKEGYLFPVYDKNGKVIPGSKAAMAYYALGNGRRYGIEKNKTEAINTLVNDLTPENSCNDSYLWLIYRTDKTVGKELIGKCINSILSKEKELSEKDYEKIIGLYTLTRLRKKADSLQKVALAAYPDGLIARNKSINEFFATRDLAKQEEIYNRLKKKYGNLGQREDYMTQNLAMKYFEKGDRDSFNKYMGLIQDKSAKANVYNSIAWPLAEKGKDLDFAAEISKRSLDLLNSALKDPREKPAYMSSSEYKRNLNSSYNMFADTYALILFKQGKVKEAIQYQEKAVEKGGQADMYERMIQYLLADKQYDKVIEKAEEFIKDGKTTSKLTEDYKTAFLQKDPDKKKLETRLNELKKVAHDKHLATTKAKMINEEAPVFTLKDLNGNAVSLESLKGKVVILDFWATWCGPCIASFPGMQMAVTKYKDDPDVKFLFIDTFERGKNRNTMVSDFIKKNKYKFHVLLDEEDENGSFKVADKYGITGIPTKVVIDPKGKMRLKLVGFGGSAQKIVDEIDLILELLKP